jgi:hypothetical protein
MWPDCTDLESYMRENVGVEITGFGDDILETAKEEFLSLSGWIVFESTRESVSFDPPGSPALGGIRMGGAFILSMPGRAIITLYSLVVGGETLTQNTDFWLQNKVGSGYTIIRFNRPVWGKPQSVVIDADWGRSCDVPAKARTAVLCLAAGALLASQSEQYQGLNKWDEAGVSETYGYEQIQRAGARQTERGRELAAQLQHPGSWG